MTDKTYVKLFSMKVGNDYQDVYKTLPGGLIVKDVSDIVTDEFKEEYTAFVDTYRRETFISKIRNKFHEFQGNLHKKDRGLIRSLLAYCSTPVPPVYEYGKFLDVGCNTGNFLRYLPESWEKYGIEISKEAYLKARDVPGVTVENTSLEKFEPDIRFDYVRLSHVIEHVADYDAFLSQLYKIMQPGGHALILTPNTNSISFWIFGKYWSGLLEPTHICLFNLENLSALCQKHNFSILEKGTYFMGNTAGSLVLALHLKEGSFLYKFVFFMFLLLTWPFSYFVNKLKLGGALYLYIKK